MSNSFLVSYNSRRTDEHDRQCFEDKCYRASYIERYGHAPEAMSKLIAKLFFVVVVLEVSSRALPMKFSALIAVR